MKTNDDLPCAKGKCPDDSVCCTWGCWVSNEQAQWIRERYGAECLVWSNGNGDEQHDEGWATARVNGKCCFLNHNGCSIHDDAECMPEYCRRFPYNDYPYRTDICPWAASREIEELKAEVERLRAAGRREDA